jgi:hypothetical protein
LFIHSFKTWPDPVRMVNLELKSGWVKEKTGKEKTRLTPAG